MHILFLDESGTPPKPGSLYPKRFVVGGIIIPEPTWHAIQAGLFGLKIRHKVRGELKWRYFAPSNVDEKNPMRGLDELARNSIRSDIYKLIASHKSIKTIACVVSTESAYNMPSVSSQSHIYALAYKGVTERFQYYLQDISKESGRKEFGIIVCDHRGKKDDAELVAEHQKLIHSTGKFISKYENVIETIFLTASHVSIGVQLADMIAGAVWRYYERGDDTWFDMVKPTLRRSPTGQIDGWGIAKMPKRDWI